MPTLSVMSFNIRLGTADDGENRWEVRKPRTLGALKAMQPDVLGLQEAHDFQVEAFLQAMPDYGIVGIGREDGREKGEFAAIAYKTVRLRVLRSDTFWLSDTPEVIASTSWGNRVTRICTWAYFKDLATGRFFYLFNLHLDHESQLSREKAVDLILNRIAVRAPGDPVIVTGDFNAGEDNAAIVGMKDGGFRDSYRIAHPDETEVGTYSGWNETMEPDKIDYIFVSPEIRVKDAEIVLHKAEGRWLSDHAPITALLEL
ncbi:endonuclease/exonuclease/phosphatase family protein [soil metagenome]